METNRMQSDETTTRLSLQQVLHLQEGRCWLIDEQVMFGVWEHLCVQDPVNVLTMHPFLSLSYTLIVHAHKIWTITTRINIDSHIIHPTQENWGCKLQVYTLSQFSEAETFS